ncbi:MAG: hypothetical protein V4697_02035 [Patescibacteria group bacterium]
MASPAKKVSLKKKTSTKKTVPRTKKTKAVKTLALAKVPRKPITRKPIRRTQTHRDRDSEVIDVFPIPLFTKGVQASTEIPDHVNGQNVQWFEVGPPIELKRLSMPEPEVQASQEEVASTPEPVPAATPDTQGTKGKFTEKAQKALGVDEWGRPISQNSVVFQYPFKPSEVNHYSITVAGFRVLVKKLKKIIRRLFRKRKIPAKTSTDTLQ